MPLLDSTRIVNNAIALIAIGTFAFLMYSQLDKNKLRSTIDSIKRIFEKKGE